MGDGDGEGEVQRLFISAGCNMGSLYFNLCFGEWGSIE
jgi:hypothetical protein